MRVGVLHDNLGSIRICKFDNDWVFIWAPKYEKSSYNLDLDLLTMFYILGEVGWLETITIEDPSTLMHKIKCITNYNYVDMYV